MNIINFIVEPPTMCHTDQYPELGTNVLGNNEWLHKYKTLFKYATLCEMCANTEFFLVRIFPHSDWIQWMSSYLSVFSPTAGKYGPE